ncbi:MAG: amino acid ABC transporter permease [Nocardioidaceae bacterium]|nr:amino acid ABC transporter permease [Nocardioidaceae bacterium]
MLPSILDGFWLTLRLLAYSAVIATVLGTLLATMRVSPIAVLRGFGTSYVNIFRNTPLVVLFIIIVTGGPQVVGRTEFTTLATVALSLYTAAFVCEGLRSGVNTVPTGQAEAARSIGMGFTQTLTIVVLPQAFRAVIPPLASVYIALAKNTSVAAAFGVAELTYRMRSLNEQFPQEAVTRFSGIVLFYVIIVAVISGIAQILERRLAVSR